MNLAFGIIAGCNLLIIVVHSVRRHQGITASKKIRAFMAVRAAIRANIHPSQCRALLIEKLADSQNPTKEKGCVCRVCSKICSLLFFCGVSVEPPSSDDASLLSE